MTSKNVSPRFTWLSGDVNYLDYGGKWVSQKFNNGNDYWFILALDNMYDACGDDAEYKYSMQLKVVAPSLVSQDKMKSALSSWGLDLDDLTTDQYGDSKPYDYMLAIEVLESYGTYSQEFSDEGNNYKALRSDAIAAAREFLKHDNARLSSSKNKLYATGLDMMAGDSLGILSEDPTNRSLHLRNLDLNR